MFAGVVALLGTICESVTKQEKNKNKDDFFFLGAVQLEGSFCSLLNSLRAGKTNYFFASQRDDSQGSYSWRTRTMEKR